MKKIILRVMTFVLVLTLFACGEEKKNESANTNQTNDVDIPSFSTEATIEETVMVDEGGVKIIATSLEYTNNVAELYVTIENQSGKDISVNAGSVGFSRNSVNNYMVSTGFINEEVVNGSSLEEVIDFSFQELRVFGINEIADIQIGFSISDTDYNDMFNAMGKVTTTAVAKYDYSKKTYQESMEKGYLEKLYNYKKDYFKVKNIYNEHGIIIESQGLVTNKDGEQIILLEVANTSDKAVKTSLVDLWINELMVYQYQIGLGTINPNATEVFAINVDSLVNEKIQKKLGINNVDSFSFNIKTQDENGNTLEDYKMVDVSINKNGDKINESGEKVYDEAGVKFIAKGVIGNSKEELKDVKVLILVQNQGKESIEIDDTFDEIHVNGINMDSSLPQLTLEPGQMSVIAINIDDDFLEENDIKKIKEITEVKLKLEMSQLKSINTKEIDLSMSFK